MRSNYCIFCTGSGVSRRVLHVLRLLRQVVGSLLGSVLRAGLRPVGNRPGGVVGNLPLFRYALVHVVHGHGRLFHVRYQS